MSEQEDRIQGRARSFFEKLRRRWYWALLALILLLLACCWLSPQTRTLVLGYYEEWFGNQGDEGGPPPTEQVEATEPQEDEGPPPTDTPTPTDEPTETEEVAQGNGTCNERCDPENSNCLSGLSCLPIGARQPGVYVCWNDAICQPQTDEPPPTDEGGGGSCGDGTCGAGESPVTCPQDCGLCGNGVCDPGEHVYNCSPDCGEPPPPTQVTCYCIAGGCPTGTMYCTDGSTYPDASCNNC